MIEPDPVPFAAFFIGKLGKRALPSDAVQVVIRQPVGEHGTRGIAIATAPLNDIGSIEQVGRKPFPRLFAPGRALCFLGSAKLIRSLAAAGKSRR